MSRRAVLFRVVTVATIVGAGVAVWLALRARGPATQADALFTFDEEIAPLLAPGLRGLAVEVPDRPHPLPARMDDPDYRAAISRRRTFRCSTGAQGFRGADVAPAPAAGVVRVGCVGDSVTFGYGVEDGEAFPALLPALLAEHGAYEVINAGVPSHGARLAQQVVEQRVLPLRPQVVTLCVGLNDVAYPFENESADTDGYRLLPEARARMGNELRARILEMVFACRRAGAAVVLLIPPTSTFYSFPDVELVGEAMWRVAADENLPLVDLQQLLQSRERREGLMLLTEGGTQRIVRHHDGGRETLLEVAVAADRPTFVVDEVYRYLDREPVSQATMFDGCHPNAAGHRRIAAAVADAIAALDPPVR